MFLYFIEYMTTPSAPLDHAMSRLIVFPLGCVTKTGRAVSGELLLVFHVSVGTKTSRAVSGELPGLIVFPLG